MRKENNSMSTLLIHCPRHIKPPDRKIPLETFDYHVKIHKFAEFHGAMAIFEGAGVKKPNRIQKPSDL